MKQKEFMQAVDTLKLARRAELLDDEGQKLIDELYVDPLPNEHVLATILKPNTTFLIGRKGTGKSTIFQRAQESIDSRAKATWAYIDIKTLFESSTAELIVHSADDSLAALPGHAIRKLLVFRAFVTEIVKEIKKQVSQRIASSTWERIKAKVTGSTAELFEALDDFLEEIQRDSYFNATGVFEAKKSEEVDTSAKEKLEGSAKVTPASAEFKAILELVNSITEKHGSNYSQVFIRVFNIRQLIVKLREILKRLGLQHLYIFIDDFSELPQVDMEEVVDSILAPFNNWSEEFIKLKVAVYPGRVYMGEIDRSKVDEVYLDIYRAYGRNDVGDMEEKAIDFTRRLLKQRIAYFCKQDLEEYFDADTDDFWRTVFYVCLGNPRILGYILYFCYETNTAYKKKISIRSLQNAARRYYEEKIFQNFRLSKFLYESFSERSGIFSLKELLEEIVKKSKDLRSYSESKVISELKGRPPTSHFFVLTSYDSILSTLELNFFITKYYEMKDRDGKEVSVYALNYGLCVQQSISFGRPRERREHRLYFVERIFDDSAIIASYLKLNQEIVCDKCGTKHPHDKLDAIVAYDMLCPTCKAGRCLVVNLSRKYEALIRSVSREELLPEAELGILKTLYDGRRQMFAKEIAAELDCSYQLVGRRGRHLAERDLVGRDTNDQGRRVFELKSSAREVYFSEEPGDAMDFGAV